MDKIEWPQLGPMELVRGLNCCTKNPGDPNGCRACPLYGLRGEMEKDCFDEIVIQAAQMIQRLYDAGEKMAQRMTAELVSKARIANLAQERGLEAVNVATLGTMSAIQSELAELGRESMVRAEPVPDRARSQRIAEIVVAGVTVLQAGEQETTEPVCTPTRNDSECLRGAGADV